MYNFKRIHLLSIHFFLSWYFHWYMIYAHCCFYFTVPHMWRITFFSLYDINRAEVSMSMTFCTCFYTDVLTFVQYYMRNKKKIWTLFAIVRHDSFKFNRYNVEHIFIFHLLSLVCILNSIKYLYILFAFVFCTFRHFKSAILLIAITRWFPFLRFQSELLCAKCHLTIVFYYDENFVATLSSIYFYSRW